MRNLKCSFSLLLFLLCVLGCNRTENSVISGTVSSCGGFENTLGKKTAVGMVSESNIKQLLSWAYETPNKSLKLIHSGCFYNCMAELSIEAMVTEDTIQLFETDHRDDPGRNGKTESGCSCDFDFMIFIPDVYGDKCTIVVNDKAYTISLKDLSGSIELN